MGSGRLALACAILSYLGVRSAWNPYGSNAALYAHRRGQRDRQREDAGGPSQKPEKEFSEEAQTEANDRG